jgi:hypothetical protein
MQEKIASASKNGAAETHWEENMGNVKVTIAGLVAAGAVLIAVPATAATLKVKVDSFKNGGTVPNKYAFCVPAAQGHTAGGQNINPSLSWSKRAEGHEILRRHSLRHRLAGRASRTDE